MPGQVEYSSIPKIVRRMAVAIGIAITILVPLSFGLADYIDLVADTRKAARLSAERVAQYAFIHGDTWRFSAHRIAELISGLAESVDMPRQIVTDAAGGPVVDIGPPVAGAKVSQDWPIVVQGDAVGFVRVESSMVPLFALLGALVVLGAGLGGATYLIVHLLPLNALRKVTGELQRIQAELAASHAKLSEAIEASPDGFALFDAEDRIVLFNRRFHDIAGLRTDDIPTGKTFGQILRIGIARRHHAITFEHQEAWIAERIQEHQSFDGAVEHELADGRCFRVVERSTAEGGRVGVWTDITALRQSEANRAALQDQFHQAQKQEAIGKLTGGMAHDFNNYLGIIIGNLDLLDEHVAPSGRAFRDAALEGAERSAQLTRSLLAFARQQPLSPRRVDVGVSLHAVATLLRRTLGEDIELTVKIAPGIWPIRIDSAQLDSCIVNLANNARDAMPRGGLLTISASNIQVGELDATRPQGAKPGDYVLIEVADAGIGMPPDVMAQAFEPFFSTKPVGHGTGLGLSMVDGFVKQSGGWIEIRSDVGLGTTVRIGLPLDPVTKGAGGGRSDPEISPAAKAKMVVLVVDDNPMLRRTVSGQLTSLGYIVLEAENGATALALLERRELQIDLLFTDVVMPGALNGHDLAKRAHTVRPGIRVLLTSGFPRAPAGDLSADRLLPKPYRLSDLAHAVRTALSATT